ncbi:MAG TPA: thiamine pyrophosphate-binding protein [Gemmataceae bacterium]|jgi:acetolactate synthase-1/2/3 large subunit|nr:thiamine pyrophosphate-binding protein [Gemmataceae bacterium]
MGPSISRRGLLQAMAAAPAVLPLFPAQANAGPLRARGQAAEGWITGKLTGAAAVVAALQQQGTACVFGIPGAQENELWDTFKSRGLPYLLVTHEFSAACMADGYARATGCPGVLCVVPGPGVTNSLSGLGEALLDSVPVVAIVGDVGRGKKLRPFQVHSLDQVALLRPVTKCVFDVCRVADIPTAIQQAFAVAKSGEPGPTAVVVPYNLLIETYEYNVPPPPGPELAWDGAAADRAVALLANRKLRVGIYAGLGCMDYPLALCQVAELLQAPVATSVSGKGVIAETHPLSVGWGYGPQGTRTAEVVFQEVDCVLAIGVRSSEVATGFYSNPQPKHAVQVDSNAENLGRVIKPDVCVQADAGLFLHHCLANADQLRRPPDAAMRAHIHKLKCIDLQDHAKVYAECGADPMALVLALRRHLPEDGLLFVDVTVSEHLAAEAYRPIQPRTYFNPTDNQAMGWSIPAAIGAQRACAGRVVATLTGDGCFLMSAMEISTAAREVLPVKFFVLDDQAYHYMQALQLPAYLRTTATILARLDYAALAQGLGVHFQEILSNEQLDAGVRAAVCHPGPVLVRVATDYRKRPIRWLKAVRKKFTDELTFDQKVRFLARIGSRALDLKPEIND